MLLYHCCGLSVQTVYNNCVQGQGLYTYTASKKQTPILYIARGPLPDLLTGRVTVPSPLQDDTCNDMSDLPQQMQDFQSIISAVVAPSMEKVISKMLTQLPPDNSSRGILLQEPEEALGSELSTKDLPPLPKRHKKGTTGP
ncbi:Hypothetical predicted protein [Pelobates cultripes]|uniref:Uncharacterized protein n=1 Tax=Pelobates cultripes TaxID=61616 RepID=A0AAD1SIE4_PELCU|nr:Hypothetical predicted protein [Pelobates cultripes]